MESENRGSKNERNIFSLLGELDAISKEKHSRQKLFCIQLYLFVHEKSIKKEIDSIYCTENIIVRMFRKSFNTQLDAWSMK